MKNKVVIYLLLIVLVLILFFQYDLRAAKRNFSDFHVPYVTAKRLLNNEEIYTFKGGLSYYKYPVFYAFLMAPFTYISERNAARVWFLINIIFLFLIFHISRKLIEIKPAHYSVLALHVITAILSFRFILQNLHEGQANLFMLLLLLLGLYSLLDNKETYAAFFLAGSIMLKYMPILFLPYFIFRKRFGLIIKIFLFIIMLILLPATVVGLERTVLLFKQQLYFLFPSSMDIGSTSTYPNQSLLACFNRFFYERNWFSAKMFNFKKEIILAIFFISAALIYSLALIRRGKGKFYLALDYGIIILCMPLFNPNAWKNFFVFIIFPYMAVVYYLIKVRGKDKFVFTAIVLSFVLNSMTSEFFVLRWAGNLFEVYSAVTFGTIILLLALIKLKFFTKEIESV